MALTAPLPTNMSFKGRLIAPYQPKGVEWMAQRETADSTPGGILADEMGLGKTVMTIASMARNPQKTTLIIAPLSVVRQWRDAFKRFSDVDPFTVTASNLRDMSRDKLEGCPIVITSYSIFSHSTANPFVGMSFDRLVLDEAQFIKNRKTKTHAMITELDAKIKWCLTGTPVCKSRGDFKSLMRFLGVVHVDGKYKEMADTFVLRRTKEDICEHVERLRLPPLHIELVESDFRHEEETKMYKELKEEGRVLAQAYAAVGGREAQMALLEQLLRMRQCVTHPQLVYNGVYKSEDGEVPGWTTSVTKLEMLREQIMAQPKQDKTLIFCHWTLEMDAIESMLGWNGFNVLRLDGHVGHSQRQKNIALFESSPDHNMMIIQIECGGVGLNLQMATRVYINSFHWNATSELQAIGRAHRTGQTKEVVVKRLAIRNSIDQYIIDLQNKKLSIAASVLSDPRISNQLSSADFKMLLMVFD